MDINTIVALVNAGYTKQEIEQMAANPAGDAVAQPVPIEPVAPDPEQPQEPEPEPAPAAVPAPAQAPAQNPEPAQPSMADIMQSIAKLTSAVQANAIAQSVIPAGLQNPPKAEDMLAEIIRPTYKER